MNISKAFLLKISTGSEPLRYATIAGLRVKAECAEHQIYSITGAGVFTGSDAETRVQANALSGAIDDYELAFESGARMRGRFLITKLDHTGDFNGDRCFTVSLQSVGEVVSQ